MAKKLKKINNVKKYAVGGYNMGSVSQMRQNPYYISQTAAEAAQDQFEQSQSELEKAGRDAQRLARENDQQRRAEERKFLADSGQNLIKAAGKDLLTAAQTTPSAPTVVNTGLINPATGQPFNMSFGKTTGGTQGVNFSKVATGEGAGVVGETAKTGLRGAEMSNLTTAGIGLGLQGAGMLTEKLTDDKSEYEFTQKEGRGNVAGEALKGAGKGFTYGAALGSALPGIGNVVGGLAGGVIGAGLGLVKGRRENKDEKELSEELLADQAARRNAFQSAFVQSRLTGADTGFGLKSSTNMNNQFTGSYWAKKGGFKKLPGGIEIDLPGGAKKYIGNTHEEGGIMESSEVEVENNETKDKVEMAKGGKVDYFFSEYLKLGNKSFAKRHEDMVKSGASQEQIQALARKQEEVAGRNPKQVAMYGGPRKYAEGGAPCPDGYEMDANGNCVPTIATVTPEAKMQDWAKNESKAMMDKAIANEEAYNKKLDAAWISDSGGYDPSIVYSSEGERLYGYKENGINKRLGNSYTRYLNRPYVDPSTGKIEFPDAGTPYVYTGNDGKKYPSELAFKFDKNGTAIRINTEEEEDKLYDEGEKRQDLIKKGYEFDYEGNITYDPTTASKPVAQPTLADDIDKMWSDKGYVKNANGDWVLPEESQQSAGTGTATYTAPAGVQPSTSQTTTGGTTGAGTGTNSTVTTTAPTTTYAKSTDVNIPKTEEEKEAARLAGLPRLFMGANRKVDEATGNVTVFTDQPLMGVGAMAGSRLGTATGSQDDLAKVTNNSYDQAWQNKADNLYTNQKDASGGGLSSSDAVADRDKIAESNWGKKYGYKKGMSAEEAKAAHGKFAEDVHSLFKNNPDEMLGYFQYIVDGGDPKNKDSYLGKDAEQIRANLTKKGFIGADGRPIAGKEKEMAAYLETQATNNAVGPIHNALGSYTAERSDTKIKLEEKEKPKEDPKKPSLEKKVEPCPPGQYRSTDGSCKPIPGDPKNRDINSSLLAGLGQLIPAGYAMFNPYKIGAGIAGAASAAGALLPRMNMNQERASAIDSNVAMTNAIRNTNTGPGSLALMLAGNTKLNDQMLKIAKQEQDTNKDLAAKEAQLGQAATQFNVENEMKRQMFNTEFKQKERQYKREEMMGALDTAMRNIAGIVKDDKAYKAQERLAKALDETGSYDRFAILEQLQKEAKRKNSPYAGMNQSELRRIAAAMGRELNPEGYVAATDTKTNKDKDKEEGKAKYGGARQYVSRLGQLSSVRSTKPKFNI